MISNSSFLRKLTGFNNHFRLCCSGALVLVVIFPVTCLETQNITPFKVVKSKKEGSLIVALGV